MARNSSRGDALSLTLQRFGPGRWAALLIWLVLVALVPAVAEGGETVEVEPVPAEVEVGFDDGEGVLPMGYEPPVEEIRAVPTVPLWAWLLPLALLAAAVISRWPHRADEESALGSSVRRERLLVILAFLVLLILVLYGGLQAGGPGVATGTQTRTRVGDCEIGSELGLRVVDRNGNSLRRRMLFFNTVKPGLRVDSSLRIVVQARNTSVSPFAGTVTFVFYRGAAGQDSFHTLSGHAASSRQLRTILAAPAPELTAPAGLSPDNSRAVEILRVVGQWDPDDLDDSCSVEDQLTVIWRHNPGRDGSFEFLAPPPGTRPRHRSRVRFNPEVIEETTGFPGRVNFATETIVTFGVDDAFGCCNDPGSQYAIIQFVRHRWRLGGGPIRRDDWNLDGPEDQAANQDAGRPYDPTYAGPGSQLFGIGPWNQSGGDAISVRDFPGLLDRDHRRFVRQGGQIEWEFFTLLVCLEDPPTAEQYRSSGRVQAVTRFKIVRSYTAGDSSPTVVGKMVRADRKYFPNCVSLQRFLTDEGLLGAFDDPRPHVLPLGG